MGCGKSTILKKLRAETAMSKFSLIDLDDYILQQHCEQEGSLADLIEKIGFPKFRELELENIIKLSRTKNTILALGGGSLSEQTIAILNEKGWSGHWLNTNFDICLARIRKSESTRPLAARSDQDLQDLYQERKGQYSSYPSFTDYSQLLEILKI